MADKPATPEEGKPDDVKVETEAAEAKATAKKPAAKKAADKPAAEKKPAAAKKPAAEKKPTAAKKTKVDTKAADAVAEGDADPKAAATEASKTEGKAKKAPAKKPAARKDAAKKPATKPSRRRRPAREAGDELVVVNAHAKYVRSSARKARLVCNQIRGKSVPEARALLAFSPRDVAEAWTKLLDSAVANAEHNHDLVGDDLKVLAVFADEGPTIKRFRPRAMGRATQIRKRTSHLTIQLTPKEL
jgi:ribosomal protein L22